MKQRPSLFRFWDMYKTKGFPSSLFSASQDSNAEHIAYLRSLAKEKRRQEVLHIPLKQLKTVVFDLETTGFSPEHGDEIISIGAVAVNGNQILQDERFYSLIKTKKLIPPHIETLTRITNSMMKEAPNISLALIRFFQFIGDRVLIAHGTGHDGKFLNMALRRTSRTTLTNRLLDTMMIGCKLHPNKIAYTLDDWLRYYQLAIDNRHHALHDSFMTAKLWVCFMEELEERDVKTLADMYHFLGK